MTCHVSIKSGYEQVEVYSGCCWLHATQAADKAKKLLIVSGGSAVVETDVDGRPYDLIVVSEGESRQLPVAGEKKSL